MRNVLVSAADEKYFPLLKGLVDSYVKNAKREDCDFYVIDLGLSEDQIEYLSDFVSGFKKADWDLDFSCLNGAPEFRKAFTVVPFLPKYFPGYNVIVWVDADAWFQTRDALDCLIDAAILSGKLVVCPEIDVAYPSAISRGKVRLYPDLPFLSGRIRRIGTWLRSSFNKRYDKKSANLNLFSPVLNSGVFAAKVSSSCWEHWADAYRQAKIKTASDLCDQTPLNYAVYTGKMDVYRLPATYNWICDLALPVWSSEKNAYVTPGIPHHVIGIIHLLGLSKNATIDVVDDQGVTYKKSLRFSE